MHWKEYIKEYFTYTAKEKRGTNILLILLIALLGVYFYINHSVSNEFFFTLKEKSVIDSLITCFEKSNKPIDSDTAATRKKQSIIKKNKVFRKEHFTIDINSADTIDWKKIKGIGHVLSNRIIKYRYLLGGFINIAQLKEVYGIDSILYLNISNYLTLNPDFIPQKIHINHAESWELSKHPYINKELTEQIISYRKKNNFISWEDFCLNLNLNKETISKLKPYIIINN